MRERLKINWFSPLPPTRSDIARHTSGLLPELSDRAEVVVWCNDGIIDGAAKKHATIKRYDVLHPPWREINAADVTFYHMGNDPRYHADIWRMSRAHPGIVILHDLKLQHFFAGLVGGNATMALGEYFDLVEKHHGALGRARAESFFDGNIGIDQLAEDVPLSGAAIEGALGVIAHSEVAYNAIAAATSLPVAYLPLSVGSNGPADDEFLLARERNGRPYHIIVFGYLGPNRRLASIVQALASFPQRNHFRLDIYGTMHGTEKIEDFACRLGIGDLVTLHGFAPEDELAAALRRSHLAINLRNPSMGEASGSQLCLWQYALPALVSQTAWYASLPDDTVAFVRPDHEIEDIQSHLARFLEEPEHYRRLGLNGRRYVNEHCTVSAYVDGIMEMAARVPELHSAWIARHLAERAGRTMSRWTARPANAFSAGVAREIQALVSGYFPPAETVA
ncbi:MAG TPA: glycosyltransferase [Chthoniobacterales bacterium]|nr:glycosyltransferase [Chthoniobacterales bacterium]